MLENPRMWEFMPEQLPIPLTDEATRALIEMGSVAGHQEALAVEHTLPPTRSGAGVPVGQCLLRFDEPFEGIRAAEVAYWLDEEHWGKGWMTRILPAFVARGMRMHDVDVVYAWIREDHAASRRVAERAGFERDTFVLEEELAEATRRPGFVRYATYRPAWVPLPLR